MYTETQYNFGAGSQTIDFWLCDDGCISYIGRCALISESLNKYSYPDPDKCNYKTLKLKNNFLQKSCIQVNIITK